MSYANANTNRTGDSRLLNDPPHPIHTTVPEKVFAVFRQWCYANNTTPTCHTRALIEKFVETLKEKE